MAYEREKLTSMHVCFFIPAMGGGGAERTMANLLSLLHAGGERVTLVTFEAPDTEPAYALPNILIERLDLLGGRGLSRIVKIWARRREIRRAIQRIDPDVVVSFMDTMNVAVLVAARGLNKPIVISERVDPAHHPLPGWKKFMRRLVYPSACRLVLQTRRVAQFFGWMDPGKIAVIPNPIHAFEKSATPDRAGGDGRFRIVAVGRLAAQKGFDDLIRAFASLSSGFPLWDLVIYGDGEERDFLNGLIRGLAMEGRVFMPGWQANIEGALTAGHVMAFPSHYEGFPNALCEAAAAGLPLVGFADVSGVEEIILDSKNGVLVRSGDRVEGLRTALSTLMGDADLRLSMGQKAKVHSQSWNPERVESAWRSLLQAVSAKNVA